MDRVGTNPRHAAIPQRIRWCVLGRSPGLEVLVHRLPGIEPSGILMNPHFLTVAGAAPESTDEVSPASRFTRHGKPCTGTTNRARSIAKHCALQLCFRPPGRKLDVLSGKILTLDASGKNLTLVKEIAVR